MAVRVPLFARNTIYYEFELNGQHLKNGDPTQIHSFRLQSGKKAIDATFKTEDGYERYIKPEKEWIREQYLYALASVPQNDLIKRKWISAFQYRKLMLPPSYKPKFRLNDKVYLNLMVHCYHTESNCECRPYKIVVSGTIVELAPHSLLLQLSPQFKFQADNRELAHLTDGWHYTAELSKEKREWEQLTISKLQFEELKYLISIGITKKLDSLLIKQVLPRSMVIDSSFFMKFDLYQRQLEIVSNCFQQSKLLSTFAIDIMQSMIQKSYLLCPKVAGILSFSLNRRATVKNSLKYGNLIKEYMYDTSLLKLVRRAQIPTKCNDFTIICKTTVDKLRELDLNTILKIGSNGEKTQLIGQFHFAYNREVSHLLITKMSFDTDSNTMDLQEAGRQMRNKLRAKRKRRKQKHKKVR